MIKEVRTRLDSANQTPFSSSINHLIQSKASCQSHFCRNLIAAIAELTDKRAEIEERPLTTVSKFFFLLRTLQLIDCICLGANSSDMHNKVES